MTHLFAFAPRISSSAIRLTDLHPVWLSLFETGSLTSSAAALLHRYATVPDLFQEKAHKIFTFEKWQIKNVILAGEPIPLRMVAQDLHACYSKFLRPLSDVKGYDGPIVEASRYGSYPDPTAPDEPQSLRGELTKYAADPKLWGPIWRKKQKAAKERAEKTSGPSSSGYSREHSKAELDMIALQKAGIPVEAVERYSSPAPKKGETRVFSNQGWRSWHGEDVAFDAATFIATVDRSKLLIRSSKEGYGAIVVTKDADAINAARARWEEKKHAQVVDVVNRLQTQIVKAIDTCRISGPGATLVWDLDHDIDDEPKPVVAYALGVDLSSKVQLSDTVVDQLASAYLGYLSGMFKIPARKVIEAPLHKANEQVRFKLPDPANVVEKVKGRSRKAASRESGSSPDSGSNPDARPVSQVPSASVSGPLADEPPKRKRGRPLNAEKGTRSIGYADQLKAGRATAPKEAVAT